MSAYHERGRCPVGNGPALMDAQLRTFHQEQACRQTLRTLLHSSAERERMAGHCIPLDSGAAWTFVLW